MTLCNHYIYPLIFSSLASSSTSLHLPPLSPLRPLRSAPPQAQNPGFHKLIVRLGDKSTELDLNIVLTPYKDGQAKPKIATQFPA